MKNWPVWIPYPGAWMSAILLTMLTGSLGYGIRMTWEMGYFFGRFSPRLSIFFGVLAILSPIMMIAIAHHLIHLFMDRFFPDSQSQQMGKTQGFFPGIMSWWEGVYGWLVLLLASLITLGILGPFFPSLEFILYRFYAWNNTNHLVAGSTTFWVIAAAFLYQFQYLVQRHLMSSGANEQPRR